MIDFFFCRDRASLARDPTATCISRGARGLRYSTSGISFQVKVEGRTQFLSAVCMSCLEGSGGQPVRCRFCTQPWDGSSLVLGTMYSYDIFAAMPCCSERLKVSPEFVTSRPRPERTPVSRDTRACFAPVRHFNTNVLRIPSQRDFGFPRIVGAI